MYIILKDVIYKELNIQLTRWYFPLSTRILKPNDQKSISYQNFHYGKTQQQNADNIDDDDDDEDHIRDLAPWVEHRSTWSVLPPMYNLRCTTFPRDVNLPNTFICDELGSEVQHAPIRTTTTTTNNNSNNNNSSNNQQKITQQDNITSSSSNNPCDTLILPSIDLEWVNDDNDMIYSLYEAQKRAVAQKVHILNIMAHHLQTPK
eukprot:UN02828